MTPCEIRLRILGYKMGQYQYEDLPEEVKAQIKEDAKEKERRDTEFTRAILNILS